MIVKKIFYTFLAVVVFYLPVLAQFSTSNTAPYNSAYYLVNDVFAGGSVSISNVVSYGTTSQMGFFTGNAAIGLDSGLVLSTGTINSLCNGTCSNASTVPGNPGNSTGATFGFPWMGATTGAITNNNLYNVSASVPSLLGFGSAPNDVNDAAVISFDFVPTLDTMRFRFIFASKEWPNYPCTVYNDVFGFFVSGPGINGGFNSPPGYPNGATNFATIPNTNIPITITSISGPNHNGSCNTASFPQYFVPNVPAVSGMGAHYTTIMEVEFIVQPCQTYNFTMGIADGSDGTLDSYVLMEANSFNSSGVQVSFNADYNLGGDSILYEGCGSVEMEIIRSDNIPNSDTIHFNISGNATNGIDYTLLPDSVIFAPGQTTFSHTFFVLNDNIVESPETILVYVTDTNFASCSGTGDTLRIVIYDPIPLLSDAWSDTIMCSNNNTTLAAGATGLSPFNFIWSTGDTTDTISLNPAPIINTDYYVTITDACSLFTIIDTAHLVIQNPVITINAPSDTIDCESFGAPVFVTINNPMPNTNVQWSTGHTGSSFWVLNPLISTSFTVNVNQNCSGQNLTDTFELVVLNPPFTVTIADDTISCVDGGGTLTAALTNNTPSFVYQWSNGGTGTSITVNPPVTTTYYFTATDACGINSLTDSATIYVINDPIVLQAPNKSVQCIGDTAMIQVFATGGYPPYNYAWSGGGTDSTKQVILTGNSASYTVTVTDICGLNTATRTVNVNMVTYPPLYFDPLIGDTFNCSGNTISIGGTSVQGGSGDYNVSWDNWLTTNNYLFAVIDSTTTFTIEAFDNCNHYTTSQTLTYVVKNHDPLLVTLPADTHLCQQELLTIVATVTGGAGNNSYRWNNGTKGPILKSKTNTPQYYVVTVTDDCGSIASADMDVYVSKPKAEFEHFFFDAFNLGFRNLSEDASTYYWTFGDGDTSTAFEPLKEYMESKEYNVLLISYDDFGCLDSVSHKVTPPLIAFLPNAFTPNGDNLNDVFEIYGEGFKSGYEVKEFRIVIYDRWGGEVFSSTSANFKWDGTKNGEKVMNGLYIYKITVEGYGQQKIDMIGSVQAIF